MLGMLGDEANSIPDLEDTRRHKNALAGVDQDAVAAQQQRFHGIAVVVIIRR